MFVLETWRWTVCGLTLDLSDCVGDLEIDRMWIDCLRWCLGDGQNVDCFLTVLFALLSWRKAVCGLIIDLSVCVGDFEADRMWIDS